MSADASLLRQSKTPITLTLHGARVLYWPSPDAQQPTATLVFVVGNPGLADFYIPYLTQLQQLIHADGRTTIEIFCTSHLGHDPHALTQPSRSVSLDEQIRNKADILSTITGRWTGVRRPTLILSGHSIGAYVALEIVRRQLSVVPIQSVHLLFPAIHQIGSSPNAARLAWLLKVNDQPIFFRPLPSLLTLITFFVSIVLRIVQCLPLPFVHFLILCAAPSQSLSALKITSDFILDRGCVQQALYMARDEMKYVQKVEAVGDDGRTDENKANGETTGRSNGHRKAPAKLRAYWASGDIDGWAPASTRSAVEQTLNLQTYELPADITDKGKSAELQRQQRIGGHKKSRSYTMDEIREARRAGQKRRALAGMVHAGASAGYGLASTLGNLGYRGVGGGGARARARRTASSTPSGGGPPPAPSARASWSRASQANASSPGSPKQVIRRRPSLVAARASRRFDGTIVIEPAAEQQGQGVEEIELDLLARDPEDEEAILTVSPQEELQSPFEERIVNPDQLNALTAFRMPDRASIVCKLGMPHAFVLEHSEQMATISSAMIIADLLS